MCYINIKNCNVLYIYKHFGLQLTILLLINLQIILVNDFVNEMSKNDENFLMHFLKALHFFTLSYTLYLQPAHPSVDLSSQF